MNRQKTRALPCAAVEAELLAHLFCGPLTADEAAAWLTEHEADEALAGLVARGSVVIDGDTGCVQLNQRTYRHALGRIADAILAPSLPRQRGEDDPDPCPAG